VGRIVAPSRTRAAESKGIALAMGTAESAKVVAGYSSSSRKRVHGTGLS
jgi:hypothetical protein